MLKVLGKVIRTILIILAVLGAGFIYAINRSLDEALKTVTDPSRYSEIRAVFDHSSIIQHFPPQIPSDAQNVSLYYQPGFLQGGAIFQLRMTLPPAKLKQIESEFLKQGKRKYIPGGKNNSPISETTPQGMNVRYEYQLYAGEATSNKFPNNYKILVFEDTRGAPKYDWNHPDLYGVAIDISASEIVYWVESG